MNVYIETNFVLELAFQQEQYKWCEDILSICTSGKAQLVIPAYSLAEAHEKLGRQRSKRFELQSLLDAEVRQLRRTAVYATRLNQIQGIADLVRQSITDEAQRLTDYRNRILAIAHIIPLTATVFQDGAQYEQLYSLQPQDALVCASVLHHLREQGSGESCFLNRNTKDFDTPSILQELTQYNCRMIPLFDQEYYFINTRVA